MLHPLLEAVFRALDEAGITWSLLRLPSNPGAPTGDVDLLVSPPDRGRLQRVLESLGFVRMPTSAPATHALFLTYHRSTDRWITLHVVTELTYGPRFVLHTRAEQGCLARRQRTGAMTVLAPDDGFWALLLHCLVDKGTVALHYRARLQELARAAQAEGPLAQVVKEVCPVGWTPARLIRAVQRGEWSALEAGGRALTRRWCRRERAWVRLAGSRVRQLVHKPLLLSRRRGVSIALLGANGVGKSTLASSLQRTFCLPVHTVYMGLWRDEARGPLGRGLAVAGRPLLAWWRYRQAQYQQALGRVVIFDRYTYDALQPPRPPYVWLKVPYLWLIAHACPAPDAVLVLDAPGAVIYGRKAENSLEETQSERQQFLALAHRLPQLQIVDAHRAQDAVRVDVTERLWQHYVARWRSPSGPAHQAGSPRPARLGEP
jgi:thymidylate kinase